MGFDIAVIGAQKAASSFVHRSLAAHPAVHMPAGEQPTFEDPHWRDGAGPRELISSLRAESAGRRIAIKRPDYLCRAEIPARFAAVSPDSRLVVVLREPVARAVSAYFHYMRMGLLPVLSPEVGLPLLIEKRLDQSYVRAWEVLEFGRYGTALSRWFQHFSPDAVTVLDQEQTRLDGVGTIARLYRDLDLAPFDVPRSVLTGTPMQGVYSPTRLHLLAAMYPYTTRTVDAEGHIEARPGLRSKMLGAIDSRLLSRLFTAPAPTLSPELANRLREFYRDDQSLLAQLRTAAPPTGN